MTINKLLTLMGLLLVAVVAYWLIQLGSTGTVLQASGRLFTALESQANEVDRIVITGANVEVVLARNEGVWCVENRHCYPANFTAIRDLVLGMAGLNLVEAKTRKPERYARLDLNDTSEGVGHALRVTLQAKKEVVADLLIGKSAQSLGLNGSTRYYSRKMYEAQSWLVEGALDLSPLLADWFDSKLFVSNATEIKSIRVHHPDGEILELRQDEKNLKEYHLSHLANGQLLTSAKLNQLALLISNLEMQDVRPQLENQTELGYLNVILADESMLKLVFNEADNKQWLQIALTEPFQHEAWRTMLPRLKDRWFLVEPSNVQALLKHRADWVKTEENVEKERGSPPNERPTLLDLLNVENLVIPSQ